MSADIAYYISDYGYGHAARSIAVIRRLLQALPHVRLHVCTASPAAFIQASLFQTFGERVTYRDDFRDLTYILRPDSMEPDPEALRRWVHTYVDDLPERIRREEAFLRERQIRLVLTDICASPIPAANRLGIPAVGISNFTWQTALEDAIGPELGQRLAELYRGLDGFIALAGSQEPPWGRTVNASVGFFSRAIDPEEVRSIRRLAAPGPSGRIVFVGLGMKIGMEQVSRWPLWEEPNVTFIVSGAMRLDDARIHRVPEAYTETQNYIAAADAVITKAGWGTVSEAVAGQTELILLARNGMPEDERTMAELQRYRPFACVPWEALQRARLSELPLEIRSHRPAPRPGGKADGEAALDKILQIVSEMI